METLIVKGRYKVIRVLRTGEHFAAVQAVDITDSSNGQVILNIYDGPLLKPYIGYIEGLRHCAEYVELFLFEESAVAVFRYREGKNIDSTFCLGHKVPLSECMKAAGRLIEKTIAISDYPPNVSCPLLMTEQLFYAEKQADFSFSHIIVPLPEMNARELCLLLTDQLRKILTIRYDTPLALRRLIRRMDRCPYTSVLQLSSSWHEIIPEVEKEAAVLNEGNLLKKIPKILELNVRDVMERIFNSKRKTEVS